LVFVISFAMPNSSGLSILTFQPNVDGKAPSNLTGLTLLAELALRHDDRIDHMDDAVRGDYVSLRNLCIVNLYAASRINRNL
jgi:hypothetical protein